MNNLLFRPLTVQSFEQLCDAYRDSMARAFDFQISDKKRNKLRDAVSYMLGHANGYQQAKTTFDPLNQSFTQKTDGEKHISTARDVKTLFTASTEGKSDYLLLTTQLHDAFDAEYTTIHTMPSNVFDVNRDGSIADLDENEALTISDYAYIQTLQRCYCARGVYITYPDASKYGVPDYVKPMVAHQELTSDFGFDVCDFNQFEDNHFIHNTRDDSSAMIHIFLERKPQENIIEYPRGNARDDDCLLLNSPSDAPTTKTETTERPDDGFPQYLTLEIDFDVDPWEFGDAFIYQMQGPDFVLDNQSQFYQDNLTIDWPHFRSFFLASNPKGLDVEDCAELLQQEYRVEGMLVTYPLEDGQLPRSVLPRLAANEIQERLGLSIENLQRFSRQHYVADGDGKCRIFMVRK